LKKNWTELKEELGFNMIKDFEKKILAYSLKNAVEHNGKAIAGAVINSLFNEGLEKNKVKEIIPQVNAALKKVNSMSLEEQKNNLSEIDSLVGHRKEREGLPELENVKKTGVVMRFSPSPSGLMHLGHVLTGMISSLYVKKYGGKFYLQIEDTNPEKINPKAYDYLAEDADWIFGNVSEVIIQSDRIEFYYKYAKKLLDKGSAYVCTCNPEEFKKLIVAKKPCPCRNLSSGEHLNRWEKMLKKDKKSNYKEGEAVLRFKSDLNDPNPAMRDFPLARINETPHQRQGKKYRVWPLMNLAVAVDDIELKKTHIIRAKEHRDNALRQKMIYKALGLEKQYPQTYFLGRWRFTDLPLSKSETQKLIEEGKFTGWEDIRIPIVRNFKKRGYQPEAFEKIVVQRGISEVDKVIEQKDFFELLNKFNREIIKEKAEKAGFEESEEKKANIKIIMPDGKFVYGASEIKPKKDYIAYFTKLGYAKFSGKEEKKQVFYFAHE
jgi:glutamyl-tRNA synthetase